MSQLLIQNVNQMKVTASFKNAAYFEKFGFDHWGMDCVNNIGNLTVYSSGDGVVVRSGFDNNYGNFVVVIYPDVKIDEGNYDIIANYFHFSKLNVGPTNYINKDTVLGQMGTTGSYSTGIHLHTEIRIYHAGDPWLCSPFGTNIFTKDVDKEWLNPMLVIHPFAGDMQVRTFDASQYINDDDKVYNAKTISNLYVK